LSSAYTSNPPTDASHATVARINVMPLGEFFVVEIGAAFAVAVTAVVGAASFTNSVVVVISTGAPRRSGTSVWDGPDAGGGIGAPLRAGVLVVVVVAPRAVVVVALRVVVVVVAFGVVVVVVSCGGAVVVGIDESGSGTSVWARAPAKGARHIPSAPKQTQRLRRISQS
jgi:hypothetical protein